MTAPCSGSQPLWLRRLGRRANTAGVRAMRPSPRPEPPIRLDELWWVEHPPVFTQGLAGKPEHLLAPGDIPVIQVDRGGQVTYHGPRPGGPCTACWTCGDWVLACGRW
jgi:lipoyl(octanoyl) transferase